MRWLLLLVLPTATAAPWLSGVVADLPGTGLGEGVAVWSDEAVDLTGWSLSDGEDTWTFPPGAWLAAGEEAWVVAGTDGWRARDGPRHRWSFDLRLGNDGDEVHLMDPDGAVVDAFAYGDGRTPWMSGSVRYTDAGLVYRRIGGHADTDSADDWRTPRMHRIGQSDLEAPTFEADGITVYAAPDSAHAVLRGLIRAASERLHLHVYDLAAPELVDALVDARLARGVDLQVLLEDAPVGLEPARRAAREEALSRVAAAGGHAYLAGSERYRFHHLKVLVADDAVAVQTENWVPASLPPDGSYGQRGWGVVVHDAEVADWFAAWMGEDRAAYDALPWLRTEVAGVPRPPPLAGFHVQVAPRHIQGPVQIVPVISPDHTADPDAIWARLLAGASHRLWSQQLDVRMHASNALGWSAPDPFTQALGEAASRGVDVRLQVAAPFGPDDHGNREVLASLVPLGVAGREFRHPALSILHNKGALIDDRYVLVGSMNGNHHSRSMNREAGLILDSPEAAAYFADLFEADWQGDAARDWSVPLDDVRALPATQVPTLFLALGLLALCRCFRS